MVPWCRAAMFCSLYSVLPGSIYGNSVGAPGAHKCNKYCVGPLFCDHGTGGMRGIGSVRAAINFATNLRISPRRSRASLGSCMRRQRPIGVPWGSISSFSPEGGLPDRVERTSWAIEHGRGVHRSRAPALHAMCVPTHGPMVNEPLRVLWTPGSTHYWRLHPSDAPPRPTPAWTPVRHALLGTSLDPLRSPMRMI